MRKLCKAFSSILGGILILCTAGACIPPENQNTDKGETPVVQEKIIKPLSFEDIEETDDLNKFITEVDNSDGSHNNEKKEIGTIVSPILL